MFGKGLFLWFDHFNGIAPNIDVCLYEVQIEVFKLVRANKVTMLRYVDQGIN